MRACDRDLIRGGHYGQRPCVPHLKAEHMAAPTKTANVKKALANSGPSTHANSGPSTHGTKRTFAAPQHFVRYWTRPCKNAVGVVYGWRERRSGGIVRLGAANSAELVRADA
jgi:hypothetical protein